MTVEVLISVASLMVAIAAAVYAYRAPIKAVERAEELRKEATKSDQEQAVFNILMAERGNWASQMMISALNSTKVIFAKDKDIINKWYKLNSSMGKGVDIAPPYFDLIEAIAKRRGTDIRREDIESYFINSTVTMEQTMRHMQVADAYERLTASPTSTGQEPSA